MYSISNRQVIQSLKSKIKSNSWILTLQDEVIRWIPDKKRGNKPYAWWKSGRMGSLQNELNKSIKIRKQTSNIALITLTIDPKNFNDQQESWNFFKKEMPKFMRKLKAKTKLIEYIYCREAHQSGYCHSHVLACFPDLYTGFLDKKSKLRNVQLTQMVKQLWTAGLSDVVLGNDKSVANYVTKEVGKFTQVEDCFKRYDSGKSTSNDIKALWTHYYGIKTKSRLFNTSQSLVTRLGECQATEPDIVEECLVYNRNKSTQVTVSYSLLCKILDRKPPPYYTMLKAPPEDARKVIAFFQKHKLLDEPPTRKV